MSGNSSSAFVKVENVYKDYGNIKALKNISFEIHEQELVGLLGPNGAGKSTLGRILVTLLRPSSGEVRINGFRIETHTTQIREIVGFVPSQPSLYLHLNAIENLLLFSNFYGIDKKRANKTIIQLLNSFELWEWRNVPIKRFSTGMIQKINICRGLLHDPKLLVLDEPFNGLDPVSRATVKTYLLDLLNQGTTILLTTHFMDSVDNFIQKVMILNRGEVYSYGELHRLKEVYLKENHPVTIEVRGQLIRPLATGNNKDSHYRLSGSKSPDFFVFEIDEYGIVEKSLSEIKALFFEVYYFNVKEPTLEDIFVAFTKKNKLSEVHV
jgi:ABC-2 type transport system ATP-binding protein